MDLIRAKTDHFIDQGFTLGGVVHVGAHIGQEIPWYLHRKMTPIIAIEPQPIVYIDLVDNFRQYPDVFTYNLALGDANGEATIHVFHHLHDDTEDTQSASALDMDLMSDYPWGDRAHTECRDYTVPLWRFDALAPTLPLDEVNTLVIDVQGMELEVLQGFGDELDRFDFLSVECSDFPIYQGEASASEVIDYLRERELWQDSPIQQHDDIHFIRKGRR